MTSKIEGISAETVGKILITMREAGWKDSKTTLPPCRQNDIMERALTALLASGEVAIVRKGEFDMQAPMTDFQALRDKQALDDMHERMPAIMDELVKKRDAENEALAEFLTSQFLGYTLPKDFNPDAGVKFTPLSYHDYDKGSWISGTNLLDASQAKAMFLRLLRPYSAPEASGWLPIEKWHEDMGAVLWTRLPIEEPPYCGTPLDDGMWTEDYYTHFTPLILPTPPGRREDKPCGLGDEEMVEIMVDAIVAKEQAAGGLFMFDPAACRESSRIALTALLASGEVYTKPQVEEILKRGSF